MVDNERNIENRQHGKKSEFVDDCGAWQTNKAQTTTYAYLFDEDLGTYRHMHERKGIFCLEKQIDGKRELIIPFDPQPDPASVLHVCRHYTSLRASTDYKRRITWLVESVNQISLVEYTGVFPGRREHGRAKSNDDSYCRTAAATMDEIACQVQQNGKPKEIYHTLLREKDESEAPRNVKQIKNKKYQTARAKRISAESWAAMSEGQNRNHLNKCFVVDPTKNIVRSTNGKIAVVAKPGAGKKKNQRKRKRCAKTTTTSTKKN